MQIIDFVVAKTSSSEAVTEVPDLVGKPMPAAFLMNYKCHGFAKFRFDSLSLAAFEANMCKLESLEDRKNVYNMLFDNVKSLRVAGSQALSVIKHSMPHETSEENLADCLDRLVPALIKKYLPLSAYEKEVAEMFDATLAIVESKRFVGS